METTDVDRFPWEQSFRHVGSQPWCMSSMIAVGLYLATWADGDGSRIFPGVENTAKDLGISESTVKRALRALKGHGWLREVKPAAYRQGLAAEYRLTMPGRRATTLPKGSPTTPHQSITSSTQPKTRDDLGEALARDAARREKERAKQQRDAEERLRRDLRARE